MNVGIATVVEFLQKKGHTVEANPNTKISEEQYAILVKEFSTDKNLRLESERFIQERQNKDRNNPAATLAGPSASRRRIWPCRRSCCARATASMPRWPALTAAACSRSHN